MSVFSIGLGPLLPDLPKIPAIWEHYQHHRTEHGENTLSFVEYLVDHFGGTDHQDAEHQSLPLYSVGVSVGVFVGVEVVSDVQPNFTELAPKTYTASNAKPPAAPTSKTAKPPRS